MVLFSNTCMLRQFLKIQFNDTSGLEILSCNVQETCKFLVKIKLSMCSLARKIIVTDYMT